MQLESGPRPKTPTFQVKTSEKKIRVLHIGNVANNSYNNVKLLNKSNFDCDAVCYDYYHIMGCPEWEDGYFLGDEIKNQFQPNWMIPSSQKFARPTWFAQGPIKECIAYCLARRQGSFAAIEKYWKLLSFHNKTLEPSKLQAAMISARARFRYLWSVLSIAKNPLTLVEDNLERNYGHNPTAVFFFPFVTLIASFLVVLVRMGVFFKKIFGGKGKTQEAFVHRRSQEIIAEMRQLFPNRSVNVTDVEEKVRAALQWENLFKHYDVIEGYATDCIFPAILGSKPFVAYEHGTLRDIPFEDSLIGYLTAYAYKKATHVIITNPDCVRSAKKLGITNYTFVPHVIDQKYYQPVAERYAGAPYVFVPSRHDWKEKNTDIAIRGFAEFVKKAPGVRLKMTSWGSDLAKSMALIKELGIESHVDLVPPQTIRELIHMARNAFAIMDQFQGFFGGIAPTALAVGTPLIYNLDFEIYRWCWTNPPPFLSATSPIEVAEKLQAAQQMDKKVYGEQSLQWLKQNYWYESVVEKHAAIYDQVLAERRIPHTISQ